MYFIVENYSIFFWYMRRILFRFNNIY